jgi:hypothetical protein
VVRSSITWIKNIFEVNIASFGQRTLGPQNVDFYGYYASEEKKAAELKTYVSGSDPDWNGGALCRILHRATKYVRYFSGL